MGWFTVFCDVVWSSTKAVVSVVWSAVVRPAVENVVEFVGGDLDAFSGVLDRVEEFGHNLVDTLETGDVGDYVRQAVARAQVVIDELLLSRLGEWGAILTLALEELTRLLGVRDDVVEVKTGGPDRPDLEV